MERSRKTNISIIAHGSMHTALNLTICSLLMPWRIFASLIKRRFSWSSSLSGFFITTFSPFPFLAIKTKPNDPRPIGSSFSRKFPHWNSGNPWHTRDLSALGFPFSADNLNVIFSAYWHILGRRFVLCCLRRRVFRELKQTTTATATGTSPNKRFNETNNSCARAL